MDKSLIDSRKFYPPSAKDAETRLKYYATRFPMGEVDSSYYAMPVPATAQLWAEKPPPGFIFNVKAFRIFIGRQTQPKVSHIYGVDPFPWTVCDLGWTSHRIVDTSGT